MADEWPFLHLNVIPSHSELLGDSNDHQELSLLPFDSSHLEAWTNITFQFDEPNVLFNNPPPNTTESQNSNSSQYLLSSAALQTTSDDNTNTALSQEIFQTSPDLQFQLLNDHNVTPFLDSQNLISSSTNTQQLPYLDPPSNQQPLSTSDHCLDGTLNQKKDGSIITNPTAATKSSIESHHQSTTPPRNNKSNQDEDHPSPVKNDASSPNNHQALSNHGSNDDEVDNRIAHDEDKRRRNTLASARFRMKKKMKEQEIERTAREMRDRVSELEKEVDNLKQENKWLRGLIVDSTASKLVAVQPNEAAELNLVESHSPNKRPNPVLGLATHSIRVPSYPQKRHKICSSPTSSTTSHGTNPCNFSPPSFTR